MVKVSIYWFILTSGESCATQRELSQWLNNQWLLLFNQWLVSNNALTLFVCWVPNKWEKVRTFHPMKFYSLLNKLIQSKRIRPMKPKHWLLEKYYRVCKCQGRCLSDHRWEEGKVPQGLFKGEGGSVYTKGYNKNQEQRWTTESSPWYGVTDNFGPARRLYKLNGVCRRCWAWWADHYR